jgi:hypothetical protein
MVLSSSHRVASDTSFPENQAERVGQTIREENDGARMHANEVQALTPLVVVAGSSGALQRERLVITGTLASVSWRCGCA